MRRGALDTTPAMPGSSSARRTACSLSAGPAKDGLLSRDAACRRVHNAVKQDRVPKPTQTQFQVSQGTSRMVLCQTRNGAARKHVPEAVKIT